MRKVAARWVPHCILQNNAVAQKAVTVTLVFDSYSGGLLPHPSYSPDMSPPDFDLCAKIKESLRGIQFSDLDELEANAAD